MKNPLYNRIKRELRSNFLRYFAIFLVIALSIAISSGFFVIQESVRSVYDNSLIDGKVEDGQVSLAFPLNPQGKQTLQAHSIVYEENFAKEITLRETHTIRAFQIRQTINLPAYFEGREPSSADELALSRIYVEQNNLKLGDLLELRGKSYRLVGIVALPDYSALLLNRGDLMVSNSNFAVALLNQDGFERLGNENLTYTYSYRLAEKLSPKEALAHFTKLTQALITDGNVVLDGVIQPLNTNITYVKDDMGGDTPMMIIAFVLILIVMAFLFTVIIQSTIEDESAVIGTLLAQGYRRGELLRYYICLPLMITFAAALLGNLLGYTLVKDVFKQVYYKNFNLFPLRLHLNPYVFLLTTSIPIGLVAGINYLTLKRKLKNTPLNFLRKNLKKTARKKAIPLPRFKFLTRFRLRILLHNITLFLVMCIGVILANLLLLYSVSAMPMIDNFTNSLDQSIPARYEYHLRGPLDQTGQAIFTFHNVQSKHEYGGRKLQINLYGYDREMAFLRDYPVEPNTREAYASEGLLQKMKLKTGDEIELSDPYFGHDFRLKIIGTNRYSASLGLYLDRQTLNHLIEKDPAYYNGIFSDEALTIDRNMLISTLSAAKMKEVGEQLTVLLRSMLPVLIVVSISIFLVVIFVLSNVILKRSALSIGYLRILGYRKKEVGKIYLGVTELILGLIELATIPLVAWLMKKTLILAMVKFNGYLDPAVPLHYYFLPAIIGFAIYQFCKILQLRKLEQADLSELLKEIQG